MVRSVEFFITLKPSRLLIWSQRSSVKRWMKPSEYWMPQVHTMISDAVMLFTALGVESSLWQKMHFLVMAFQF